MTKLRSKLLFQILLWSAVSNSTYHISRFKIIYITLMYFLSCAYFKKKIKLFIIFRINFLNYSEYQINSFWVHLCLKWISWVHVQCATYQYSKVLCTPKCNIRHLNMNSQILVTNIFYTCIRSGFKQRINLIFVSGQQSGY